MIIVTGTRRSGTSVWMQILEKGGFQILGEKFPAHWKNLIEKANPRGFYESTLVQGINYHTNPDPRTGAWIPPQKVTDVGVKIFADGLVKTDYAYITRVIYTMRDWQECEASQARMNEIKDAGAESGDTDTNDQLAAQLPAGFLWWKANFSLVRDMQTRRYPVAVFSYADLLENPQKMVAAAFEWLGSGDANAALGAVEHSLQTQKKVSLPDVEHGYGVVFDELYDTLCGQQQITAAFYDKLVQTDRRITQDIRNILS
jgi:hypothetical protein